MTILILLNAEAQLFYLKECNNLKNLFLMKIGKFILNSKEFISSSSLLAFVMLKLFKKLLKLS
jgi:hypothetical protein